MTTADLQHRFDFHPATTDEKRNLHTSMRNACYTAACVIDEQAPDGREKALAITKLEEAMMWANAAVARRNTTGEGQ